MLKLFSLPSSKKYRKLSSNQTYFPSNAVHMLTLEDVVPLDCDVLIPILAGVFVVQSQRVHDLMAKIPGTADLWDVHRLFSALATDKGCTTRRETIQRKLIYTVDSIFKREIVGLTQNLWWTSSSWTLWNVEQSGYTRKPRSSQKPSGFQTLPELWRGNHLECCLVLNCCQNFQNQPTDWSMTKGTMASGHTRFTAFLFSWNPRNPDHRSTTPTPAGYIQHSQSCLAFH